MLTVHDLGRTGLADEEQLSFAASEGRILVTRNRDDLMRLTDECFAANRPHAGIIILPRSLPNDRPRAIADALIAWAGHYDGADLGGSYVMFLS